MKIGILGGSFNPPHNGHLHLSKLAIKTLKLNQLWWIPTLYNNFKNPNIYSCYKQRLKDCQIITKPYRHKIKIINKPQIKSFLLIKELKKQYPKNNFIWVMGADSLIKMHLWHHSKQLIHEIPIAVFDRDNLIFKASKSLIYLSSQHLEYKKTNQILQNKEPQKNRQKGGNLILPAIRLYRTKQINISSTQIRQENQKKILT